jgi:DNA-binding transcriptional ArsR family regulator
MEIRVEERMKGRKMRAQILDRYGSRAKLERLAFRGDDPEARDALFELRLLDDDPSRLDSITTTTTILGLGPGDLARLTPERLRLLDHLAVQRKAPNLTRLSHDLGRDKKNLSQDLRVLEGLGLVTIGKRGRDLEPRIRGNHIHIVVGAEG